MKRFADIRHRLAHWKNPTWEDVAALLAIGINWQERRRGRKVSVTANDVMLSYSPRGDVWYLSWGWHVAVWELLNLAAGKLDRKAMDELCCLLPGTKCNRKSCVESRCAELKKTDWLQGAVK